MEHFVQVNTGNHAAIGDEVLSGVGVGKGSDNDGDWLPAGVTSAVALNGSGREMFC